jgi:hypothetical protein
VIEHLRKYRDKRFERLDVARRTLNDQLCEAINEKHAFEARYEVRRTTGVSALKMPGDRRFAHDYDIERVRKSCEYLADY